MRRRLARLVMIYWHFKVPSLLPKRRCTPREQGLSGRVNVGFQFMRIYRKFEVFSWKKYVFGSF